jgi:hypothetical protein
VGVVTPFRRVVSSVGIGDGGHTRAGVRATSAIRHRVRRAGRRVSQRGRCRVTEAAGCTDRSSRRRRLLGYNRTNGFECLRHSFWLLWRSLLVGADCPAKRQNVMPTKVGIRHDGVTGRCPPRKTNKLRHKSLYFWPARKGQISENHRLAKSGLLRVTARPDTPGEAQKMLCETLRPALRTLCRIAEAKANTDSSITHC